MTNQGIREAIAITSILKDASCRVVNNKLVKIYRKKDKKPIYDANRSYSSHFEKEKNKIRKQHNYCCICTNSRIVEFHHLKHKANGGSDKSGNIVPLCPNHHSLLHNNLLTEAEKRELEDWVYDIYKKKIKVGELNRKKRKPTGYGKERQKTDRQTPDDFLWN